MQIKTAKNLIKLNFDNEFIIKVTGLLYLEIEVLRVEIVAKKLIPCFLLSRKTQTRKALFDVCLCIFARRYIKCKKLFSPPNGAN